MTHIKLTRHFKTAIINMFKDLKECMIMTRRKMEWGCAKNPKGMARVLKYNF